MNYTQIEDYDCDQCEWSLHVEKRVWNEIDNHTLVINYIETQVRNHDKTHGSKILNPSDIGESPYLYISPNMDK
jgi:hypothetical protein